MKKPLSLFSVNLLYLVIILISIIGPVLVRTLDISLWMLISEFVFILLPVVIFLLIKKIPLKEGMRLNRIKPSVGVICVLLGFSFNLFTLAINLIMVNITGESANGITDNMLPRGLITAILFFLTLAIAAPICEEVLFRGVIQQAYEARKSVFLAITIPALMFALMHFNLTGLPGLLLVAFLLGYVAWRTRSIISTMLLHLGLNSLSFVILMISLIANNPANLEAQSFNNSQSITPELMISMGCVSLFGLVLTGIFLFTFNRLQPLPLPVEKPEEPPRKWLAVYWPLVVAFLIFIVVSVGMLMIMSQQVVSPLYQ